MTSAEAHEKAKALQKKMAGRGWKIDVWKNGGEFHYAVRNSHIGVYASYSSDGGMRYYAMVSVLPNESGTPVEWHDDHVYRDPNVAARRAVRKALGSVRRNVASVMKAAKASGVWA